MMMDWVDLFVSLSSILLFSVSKESFSFAIYHILDVYYMNHAI